MGVFRARRTGRSRPSGARGVLALVVLTASFALSTVLARHLNSDFTIAQQVYLRSSAAFVVALVAFRRRIRWRAVVLRAGRREWGVVVLRALLFSVLGTTLFSKAAILTSVAVVSFIAALPLVSAIGLVLDRRSATRARVVWVLGAAAGTVLLASSTTSGATSGDSSGATSGAASGAAASVTSGAAAGVTSTSAGWNAGALIALVAMLAISAGYIGRTWHGASGPANVPLNNPEITALLIGVGAVILGAFSFLDGEGVPHAQGRVWLAVAVAGALAMLNVFLINYAFEHVDPVSAGNLLTLESVWGLIFGLVFYGQVPGLGESVGGAVIVLCAVGMNATSAPEPTPTAAARLGPDEVPVRPPGPAPSALERTGVD